MPPWDGETKQGGNMTGYSPGGAPDSVPKAAKADKKEKAFIVVAAGHRSGLFWKYGEKYKNLIDYSIEVMKAIDFESGASHIEFMVYKEGPVLIEINNRIMGGIFL
jgi:hypothetical protein